MKRRVPAGLAHLEADLVALAAAGLLRERPELPAKRRGSFSANDYLGLAAAKAGEAPMGAGASRLVSGEHREHRLLEQALATWLGAESSLLFTSGYAANVGMLSALADSPTDLVLSDALNHASIVDGCRLARAETVVTPHLDVDAVRRALRGTAARRRWVVTESYFSMDADSPDLATLRAVCDEEGAALIVDEAHALGVLGPEGRGVCAELGVEPDVLVGTLGKAFGGAGAFVVGAAPLVAWLWNRARSFVFSTGLSPALASAGLRSLRRFQAEPALRTTTLQRAGQIRDGLTKLGLRPLGHGHIVPVLIGDAREAVRVAHRLNAAGFAVQAIRPPSVPPGTARLRFTASALQEPEEVAQLLDAVAECFT